MSRAARACRRFAARRGLGRAAVLGVAAVIALGAASVAGARGRGPTLDELRAGFVLNFARFTDWPARRFEDAAAPLRICFAGGHGVADAFRRFGPRQVQGRPALVIDGPAAGALGRCHVLYLDTDDRGEIDRLLAAALGGAVLTIGHASGFAAAGGIIGLVERGDRMTFEIRVARAAAEGLRLHSSVLKLGQPVREGAT